MTLFYNIACSPPLALLFALGGLLLWGAYRSARTRTTLGYVLAYALGAAGLPALAASGLGLPFIPTTFLLTQLPSSQYTSVTRLGVLWPGDAPPFTYTAGWGATATLNTNPSNGSILTINGTDVTFVSGAPSGNQVQIGGNAGATLTALVTFLQVATNTNLKQLTYGGTGSVLAVMAKTPGVALPLATSTVAITLSGSTVTSGGGPCTWAGSTGDGGVQVGSVDGKCFQAVLPDGIISAQQYGVVPTGDSTAKAQAVLDAAFWMGNNQVSFPGSFNFTVFCTYPATKVVGGGIANLWHRTLAAQGFYLCSQPGSGYPIPGAVPLVVNLQDVFVIADGGIAGSNITLTASAQYNLKNVGGFATDTAAATFTASVSGSTMTVTNVSQGTLKTGQMVLCQSCGHLAGTGFNVPNNTYATIQTAAVGGGVGSYTLSVSFGTSVGSTPMVASTPWTWSGPSTGMGNTTFPSANFTEFGNTYGIVNGLELGSTPAPPTSGACPSFSGIGTYLDSVATNGGGKPDANLFNTVGDWCHGLGVFAPNASDNVFIAAVHQNDIIGELWGTGASNAIRNKCILCYYEPGTIPGLTGIIWAELAQDNTVWGMGSLGSAFFTPAFIDSDRGPISNNKVWLDNDIVYSAGAEIVSFFNGITQSNGPTGRAGPNFIPALSQSRVADGDNTHPAEMVATGYQSGNAPAFAGTFTRGLHGALASTASGDVLAEFGGRGSYPSVFFTATMSGTTMAVSAVASGTFALGQYVNGAGVAGGVYITACPSACSNATGNYTISTAQTIGSEAMTGLANGTYTGRGAVMKPTLSEAPDPDHQGQKLVFATTPNGSTTRADTWVMDHDGSYHAQGLTATGNGHINALGLEVNNVTFYIPPTSYTPTIICGTGAVGAYTRQNGVYQVVGKGVTVTADVLAAIGTCSGQVLITLPINSNATIRQTLAAFDNTDNTTLGGFTFNAGAVTVFKVDGTNPAGSDNFVVSGSYQE